MSVVISEGSPKRNAEALSWVALETATVGLQALSP